MSQRDSHILLSSHTIANVVQNSGKIFRKSPISSSSKILLLLLFSNHRQQIDLKKQTDEGDVSNYQTNGEFDLVDFEAIHHEEYYSCCPEPYPDITYVIKMKRRPLFYVFNLILPCLLINGIG